MQIKYYKEISSTQLTLKNDKSLKPPILIWTNNQTNGIGSRDNTWENNKGNLFFSFAISKCELSSSLPLNSISIYIGYLIKDILSNMGSKVFLKWPNDLYIKENKLGGLISNVKKDIIIVGCGINTKKNDTFGYLDIDISDNLFLELLIKKIYERISWRDILKSYYDEFYKNNNFFIHHDNKKLSLKNAILQNDGSIIINNEKIFNDR